MNDYPLELGGQKSTAAQWAAVEVLLQGPPPLALVPSSSKRCLVHDETYARVCRGCRADEIAAEETSA